MEIQLNELIEKIKKEGITSAKEEANLIISKAEAEALSIVEQAKKQAINITSKAKEEAERTEKSGVAALEQAARNLILSFKVEIQGLLDKIVSKSVHSAFSIDIIKNILPELLNSWVNKNSDSLTVLIAENNLAQLETAFISQLTATLKSGIEIKAGKNLDAGFHIVEKDGSAFYDFSAESVAKMLSAYLNPKLNEILKNMEK